MKTLFSIIFPAVIIGFSLIQGSSLGQTEQQSGSVYPEKVKKVIDSKCYLCHNINGKSQYAKNALMWDSLPGLPKIKIIASLIILSRFWKITKCLRRLPLRKTRK